MSQTSNFKYIILFLFVRKRKANNTIKEATALKLPPHQTWIQKPYIEERANQDQ